MFRKQSFEFGFLSAVLLSLLLLTIVGCDSDIGVPDLTIGSYAVVTQTTGSNLDPDGYQLTIVGASFNFSDTIGTNATRPLSVAVSGSNMVTLSDIAANCIVNSPNPVTVELSVNGDNGTTIFDVTCN